MAIAIDQTVSVQGKFLKTQAQRQLVQIRWALCRQVDENSAPLLKHQKRAVVWDRTTEPLESATLRGNAVRGNKGTAQYLRQESCWQDLSSVWGESPGCTSSTSASVVPLRSVRCS